MSFVENNLRFIEGDGVWVFEKEPLPRVIITVPHDGLLERDFVGLFKKRMSGVSVRDVNVWPIVRDMITVVSADVVRGMIPRCFLDYNRAEEKALEDGRWLGSYNAYHSFIASLVQCMVEQYGATNCLLLDLHGFSAQLSHDKYDVILGTGNCTTIFSEVDKKLFGFLRDRGYRVFLPRENPVGGSWDKYNGGFTVRYYAEKFSINATQLEIFKIFRTKEGEENGKKLARDLAEFLTANFSVTD
jgi:N-formylglutamate amidohydrolase